VQGLCGAAQTIIIHTHTHTHTHTHVIIMIKQGALRGGADNADSEVEKKAEKKRQTRLSRSYRFSCVSVFGLVH
jgi:hypothetical protein